MCCLYLYRRIIVDDFSVCGDFCAYAGFVSSLTTYARARRFFHHAFGFFLWLSDSRGSSIRTHDTHPSQSDVCTMRRVLCSFSWRKKRVSCLYHYLRIVSDDFSTWRPLFSVAESGSRVFHHDIRKSRMVFSPYALFFVRLPDAEIVYPAYPTTYASSETIFQPGRIFSRLCLSRVLYYYIRQRQGGFFTTRHFSGVQIVDFYGYIRCGVASFFT